jgi:serine/threonine-protein kinase RsbW
MELIRLTVPASPRHATTARMVAASLAADAGFDVDEIDDVRLGINEAIAVLTDEPCVDHGDVVEVEFNVGDRRIEISVRRPRGPAVPPPDDLAVRILTAVMDQHEFGDGEFRLSKRSDAEISADGD